MRSEACCDCADVRHLDVVSPATEITRSDGAEVAGTRGYYDTVQVQVLINYGSGSTGW